MGFLELLAAAAEPRPASDCLRCTEAVGVPPGGDLIVVVGAVSRPGRQTAVDARRADIRLRRSALALARGTGLGRALGAPMDVWWFAVARRPTTRAGLAGVLDTGRAAINDRPG